MKNQLRVLFVENYEIDVEITEQERGGIAKLTCIESRPNQPQE